MNSNKPNIVSAAPCVTCQSNLMTVVRHQGKFIIAKCQNCQLMQVTPMPSAEELNAHYQNPAYFEGEETQGYKSYADMKKALQPFFARRLHEIKKALPTGKTLLDFGCAAGYFLEMARDENWQIHGVELSAEMSAQASELLRTKIYHSLQEQPKSNFDAVTLWEVIEHVPNPVEQLMQLKEKLRTGGILMLSTPNNGHWQAIREPDNWTVYRPPSHLIYFTAQTLTNTLKQAGFEKINVRGVAPLPPLPKWLKSMSEPLRQRLITGQSTHWQIDLLIWRLIRLFAWAWQKIAHSKDDIFTTLEATAFKPS